MIVADTNVVSELMRDVPDEAVVAWSTTLGPADVGITAITVQDVEFGLARLPAGRRRTSLEERWRTTADAFHEDVLAYDLAAAVAAATLLESRERLGRPMSLADAQIAGICVAGSHVLATRNILDFEHIDGLSVINPFEQRAE